MEFEITDGLIGGAIKVVLYGTEGIGKSTFASHFPDPLFIDTEGSTKKLDVRRLQKPTSWVMLKEMVAWVINERPCKTLVIDTADWAERLCIESVCKSSGKNSIEDFGYGQGYTYVAEEWGRFLNMLSDVVDIANINVVLTAHAIIRKFEQPNEMGAYDRYELKLGKKTTAQTAPITKEWADMVLFANYKTYSVAIDDKGKKHKAQGGERVMYTTHHPCWDAKNRDGLPDELPFDYNAIAHVIDNTARKEVVADAVKFDIEETVPETKKVEPVALDEEKMFIPDEVPDYDGLPQTLVDLMKANGVTNSEIMTVVSQKGYMPADMPIKDYPIEFIEGVLVNAWPQVFKAISDNRTMQF